MYLARTLSPGLAKGERVYYIYIYIYTYTCVYINIYIYTYVSVYVYIYIYVYVYIYIYINMYKSPNKNGSSRGPANCMAPVPSSDFMRARPKSQSFTCFSSALTCSISVLRVSFLYVFLLAITLVTVKCFSARGQVLQGPAAPDAKSLAGLHPVSLRRFPSFRTQPLENLSRYQWTKHIWATQPLAKVF